MCTVSGINSEIGISVGIGVCICVCIGSVRERVVESEQAE